MNAGVTSERVYDALKRRIQRGEFRPGIRLDPAAFTETLSASVTPIRDALHLLAGEGLVDSRTSDGFHIPAIHEIGLRDLYIWTAQLLGVGIGARRGPHVEALPADATGNTDNIVDDTARLFAMIAGRSGNIEHRGAIASANARLHVARLVEGQVIADRQQEFDALRSAWCADDRPVLRRLCNAYHRRRAQQVADIVRAIYAPHA
ncbi:GntR family transcriptional regulator [uncultured Sphingomonas sp.]|uniref:GntR family transcriptional regulator n=1 Tax=uncultured Sphingomonas sp. TaxID=158754 RepID=UPI00263558A8|nr:GntR family transcriptional regulator [uncultured Sphingomonas sp.]